MLNVIYAECYKQAHYAECRYAECHYAECRKAERHGALQNGLNHDNHLKGLFTLLPKGAVHIFLY
jgi:hypothetical protein